MEKPVRVLHILQRMEAGGTQALLMNIYRKIDRNKVQFDFLVEYPNEQFYDDEIKKLGGKVYYSTVRKDFNILKFCNLLKDILRKNPDYKIVHVHTYSIGYFCLKAAKEMNVPVRIAHSHNNETVHDAKYLFKLALQKIYTIYATDLFACSEEAGKYLFKDKPFQVLKNAIDSQNFIADADTRNEIRKELGLKDKFVVGHVGRLHPQKNHDFLRKNPDYKIVHVHTYSIGYFCLKAAKEMNVPVRIAHSHNNETVHDAKYLFKLALQKIYTIYATDLFACSEEAGKYLFKDKPFQVLKNAIDSQNFIADADTRNEIRKELGLKDKFVVGHVGRLHPQKNHDFLIDVFAELKKSKPDAELILVGTGPLEEKVKSKVAEKGLSDCVHFLGNRKDMNRIYQAMDVFVFPSLFEGLGIVAIEAQAAGVPIVCSEGLPPETDITPIYRKLLLSDGAEKWANAALEMAQNLKAHTNMQQYVIDAGFDMDATAKYMESYYLNRWGRR